MSEHTVVFDIADSPVSVQTGSLLSEAARLAGVEIVQPCGGQGRCGRCAVQVISGAVRRRSALRLSSEDIAKGYALACQTVVEGDITVVVPPQEKIERRLTTDRVVTEIEIPSAYDFSTDQTIKRVNLSILPPSMDDQTDDFSRLKTGLLKQAGFSKVEISLELLQKIGNILRESDWKVAAILDVQDWDYGESIVKRLIDLQSGPVLDDTPIWGIAIDVGTTTVTLWLVDLVSGQVKSQVSEYNGQISRGEDVISRIVYASKNNGSEELRKLVLATINDLLVTACKRVKGFHIQPSDIVKATISGNSTMIHLLLGIPAASIRLSPFVTAVNQVPVLSAREVGLGINPLGVVYCLPGVASYVGADITAGPMVKLY
jgi:uncharacterized 2Fe-2S/4Fe-4S cluster protein (DUF4445 family)